MVDDDKVMLAIPIDKSLHARLKIGTSLVGAASMKQYIVTLLELGTPEFSPDGAGASFADSATVSIIQSHLHLDPDTDDE